MIWLARWTFGMGFCWMVAEAAWDDRWLVLGAGVGGGLAFAGVAYWLLTRGPWRSEPIPERQRKIELAHEPRPSLPVGLSPLKDWFLGQVVRGEQQEDGRWSG